MATKPRHNIFSREHPSRGAETPPDPAARAPGVPGLGPLAEAVEGAAALRGAGAAGPGQRPAAQKSHRQPHGTWAWSTPGSRQRGGLRLLFYPSPGHILLTAFCFQPHCDLPALAESIR